jgi:hypothetical protein
MDFTGFWETLSGCAEFAASELDVIRTVPVSVKICEICRLTRRAAPPEIVLTAGKTLAVMARASPPRSAFAPVFTPWPERK